MHCQNGQITNNNKTGTLVWRKRGHGVWCYSASCWSWSQKFLHISYIWVKMPRKNNGLFNVLFSQSLWLKCDLLCLPGSLELECSWTAPQCESPQVISLAKLKYLYIFWIFFGQTLNCNYSSTVRAFHLIPKLFWKLLIGWLHPPCPNRTGIRSHMYPIRSLIHPGTAHLWLVCFGSQLQQFYKR